MIIALKCLKVCLFKQEEFYLPRVTPEGRATFRAGEGPEAIFSSNEEVSRSIVSLSVCWSHRDRCESPVAGSNGAKDAALSYLGCLTHPRYPKNKGSKGHPRTA